MINERGFANIVKSEGDWVEGLVFELTEEDEARLDKSEGVTKDCYSKRYKALRLVRAPNALYRRPVAWTVKKGGPGTVLEEAVRSGGSARQNAETIVRDVLVYISSRYITAAYPREEYVERLNLGFTDALDLGISDDYIKMFIRPWLPHSGNTIATKSGQNQRQSQQQQTKRAGSSATLGNERDEKHSRVSGGHVRTVSPSRVSGYRSVEPRDKRVERDRNRSRPLQASWIRTRKGSFLPANNPRNEISGSHSLQL